MSSSMSAADFGSPLAMDAQDMVRVVESQVLNPNSHVYQSFRTAVSQKIAAQKAINDVDKKKRKKNRVYIPYTVDNVDTYKLVAKFPHWDLRFTSTMNRGAPLANAIFQLTAEYLFDKFRTTTGKILAWGIDIRQTILRSRDWVHTCVPGHEMQAQYDFCVADRTVMAVWNSTRTKGRESAIARKYALEEKKYHCTRSVSCDYQAIAAVMMLHKTDTNLRQIAFYMRQHGVELLYYAIPGGDNLHFGTPGKLEELKAYVLTREAGEKIDLVYEGDYTLNHTYTYSNYLELLARVEYRHNGYIYRKEIDNSFLGMLVYKVTAFPIVADMEPSPTLYRAWFDETKRNQYTVYAPLLKDNGNVNKASDWDLITFSVEKELIDSVHSSAVRADGVKDLMDYILSRLCSNTMNVVVLNQILQRNKLLAVSKMDLLALVIYSSVFMSKYVSGKTVSVLAPQARGVAQLSKTGFFGLLTTYASAVGTTSTAGLSLLAGRLRRMYYTVDGMNDLPMPSFLMAPGYVEYNGTAESNPRFKSWNTPNGSPTYGFLPSLPGGDFACITPPETIRSLEPQVVPETWTVDYGSLLRDIELSNGDIESIMDLPVADSIQSDFPLTTGIAADTVSSVGSAIKFVTSFFDVSTVLDDLATEEAMLYDDNIRKRADAYTARELPSRQLPVTQEQKDLVEKITLDNNLLVVPKYVDVVQEVHLPDQPIDFVKGHVSRFPAVDMKDGLETIFPGTTLINTEFFEGDKLYGPADYHIKGNTLKIDLSKLKPLKPESFYKSVLGGGHVLPDAKTNTVNVLRTLETRNANTPDNTIPMDSEMVFNAAFDAYLKVFCIDKAADVIREYEQQYVGPDEIAVGEWVAKLDASKVAKLQSQEGFSLSQLDLATNALNLKKKVKPNLGNSYATSVKMPQSIQYDPTGKSTATLSPVIAQKVMREQAILKPNVLVMQRKSLDDVMRFVNKFDWRPDERGTRYYLEGDYTQFDKHIGPMASLMHWKKCQKFGVYPDIVDFLERQNQRRSIASVEAGIKMFLDVQRGSGHPDTLDGNNDVNQMAIAELLLRINDMIEFIILQGDDFIVAIRGKVGNLNTWEEEIARKFNLALKLDLHEHGYILSTDIVHLPNGSSTVVPDVIKRALAFQSVSNKDEELFKENYISYKDNMRGVDNLLVQNYLSQAIPKRLKVVLPHTTPEAILLLMKSHAALKSSFAAYRSMFSATKYVRHY